MLPKGLRITERLRVLQMLERIARTGYLHVFLASPVEQEEHSIRRAALVVLAGRMEIAGAVSEGRRGLVAIPDLHPQLLHGGVELFRWSDVPQDCDVLRRRGPENGREL